MSDKELYRQKKQAELDKWQSRIEQYKAMASGASADAQLEMNKQIEALDGKIKKAKTKLAAMEDIGDDAWESVKSEIESSWDSVQSAFSKAADKFQ